MPQQQCGQWIHTLTEILRGAVGAAGMLPAETSVEFKKVLDERGGEKILQALLSTIPVRSIRKPKQTFTAGRRSIRSRMR